ncbi:hypothetical protein PQ472_09320 [Lacticaseibacillus pabuli]|uniref:DNA-directed RNA polymerase beta subunit n=1 Tax=Lacticaseibacillus pabuli TaxID=3025672 RepID=A0ABY7WSZ5_9LACO|nr:hypothetical protein [Lacticaseibacillus sp. KACC 23028]WDF82086.1 hypothetical protein PQ472_09320 [Lacticaseibacillus sp. KACC 23028]
MNYQADWSDKMVQSFFDHDYIDRGMLKWQGYYLSDHTSALNREHAKEKQIITALPQQSASEASVILANAFANGIPISVQLNERDANGKLQADHIGLLRGYTATAIVIGLEQIALDSIRNVQLIK